MIIALNSQCKHTHVRYDEICWEILYFTWDRFKSESAIEYIEISTWGDKQFVCSLWNRLRWKSVFAAHTQRYLGQWSIICRLFQGMLLRWLSRDANFGPKIRAATTNRGYFGPNLATSKPWIQRFVITWSRYNPGQVKLVICRWCKLSVLWKSKFPPSFRHNESISDSEYT